VAASEYLIKGLWCPDEISVLYGPPGCGKSFLGSSFSYLISAGLPVLGRRVRSAPVVFAALEGQIGFERRIAALRDRYGVSRDFHWITQSVDLYSGQGDVEGIIDAVLRKQARLLVIDTLARAMGPGRENEGGDMGIVIAALDLIKRETGAHVALVHHCGKDAARGMRGHSSLLGAVDVVVEVERSAAGTRSMRLEKVKDGKDGDEHGFELETVELGYDDDGDAITTCIVVPSDADATPAVQKVTGAAELALRLLRKAVEEAGEPAFATPHIPSGTRTIHPDMWRSYCYQGQISDSDDPDARRKAFVRASKTLQIKNLVGVWGNYVWLR
jgi:hypothetical protein